jgi:hypothetical protein
VQYADGDDATFVFTETNLPWETLVEQRNGRWARTASGSLTADGGWLASAAGGIEDQIERYRPSRTTRRAPAPRGLRALRDALLRPVFAQERPAVDMTFPTELHIGRAATATIRITGINEPLDLVAVLLYDAPQPHARGVEAPVPPQIRFTTELRAIPVGGSWSGTVTIPGEVLDRAGAYEFQVGPHAERTGPDRAVRLDVRGLPIELTVPPRVNVGDTFEVRARVHNDTSRSAQTASLSLRLPTQITADGATESSVQQLGPGRDIALTVKARATAAGDFMVHAGFDSSLGPSEALVRLAVAGPARLALEGEPVFGATPGQATVLTAVVMNDSPSASGPVESQLDATEGVQVVNAAVQSTASIPPFGRWTPTWTVRVGAAGTYQLPIRAAATSGPIAQDVVVLVSGAADEEAAAIEDSFEPGFLAIASSRSWWLPLGGAIAVVGLLSLLGIRVAKRRQRPGATRLELRLASGESIALRDGVLLTAGDLLGVSTAPDGTLGEVTEHPTDRGVLGLTNLSQHGWSATLPSGSQRTIDPGKSIRLARATTVVFGPARAAIVEGGNGFLLDVPAGRAIPLTAGARVTAGDVLGLTGTSSNAVGRVGRHPTDKAVLGLQNLTAAAWSAVLAGGGLRQIEPGKSVRLAAGTTIDFGPVKAVVGDASPRQSARSVGTP